MSAPSKRRGMHPVFQAFWKAMDYGSFTPAFNEWLDAEMRDPLAEVDDRIKAWMLRTSWGHWSEFCISHQPAQHDPEKEKAQTVAIPLRQKECCQQLRISKGAASKAFKDLKDLGLVVIDKEGRIYPQKNRAAETRIEEAAAEEGDDAMDDSFELFRKEAGPQYEPLFAQREQLQQQLLQLSEQLSQMKRELRKTDGSLLNLFKKWKREHKNGEFPMYETGELPTLETAGSQCTQPPSLLVKKGKGSIPPSSSSFASQEPETGTTTEVQVILTVLSRYAATDPDGAARLISDAKAVAPDVSTGELQDAIELIAGRMGDKVRSPIGYIASGVARLLKGPWRQHRAEAAAAAAEHGRIAAERAETERAELYEQCRLTWCDPMAPLDDKELAAHSFPELREMQPTESEQVAAMQHRTAVLNRQLNSLADHPTARFGVQQELNDRQVWLEARKAS